MIYNITEIRPCSSDGFWGAWLSLSVFSEVLDRVIMRYMEGKSKMLLFIKALIPDLQKETTKLILIRFKLCVSLTVPFDVG